MFDFNGIAESLAECNKSKVTEGVQKALDEGVPAKEILDKGLMGGMDLIGQMMEREEILIPEVLMAAKIMGETIEQVLSPFLVEDDIKRYGKVVFATVKGDVHDIGKNLVIMMMESAGFEIHDMGIDVPPEKIVSAIQEKKPEMLCLSALLTTTMPMVQETIDVVTENGMRDHLKILVGGAPVNQEFADEVGADGYAPDASSATKLAKSLFD